MHLQKQQGNKHRKYKQETNKNAICGCCLVAKLHATLLRPQLLHRKCTGELWRGKRWTQNFLVFAFLYRHTL